MQQQEYVGFGSVNNLSDILLKYNPRNIFLITGKNSYEKSGAKKIIGSILSGYRITHFYDFEVNPKLHDIENGISIFNKNDCNFVIAVGGGSVIDVAKSINVLASNEGKPPDYIKTRRTIENKGMTLVAIPTTSGSGSVMVYGVLETLYDKKINVEEGVKLALKCINAAVQRDIASGDGIDIVSITKDGVKKVLSKEISTKIEV